MSAAGAPRSAPRTVMVTGAGRGLGRALALHLAVPGTRLFLHHNASGEGAQTVRRDAEAKGAEAVLLAADLTRAAERERMMTELASHASALHLLINSAGIYPEQGLLEGTAADWQRVFDVTCSAVFHLTQLAVPLLRAGAPSCVVNLGDSGADRVVARTTATPYHVAKLGVHVLTRSFAKALGPDGIRVNQISPGFLENSVGQPESPIPLGRLGRFEDILAALDYLLSPGAEYVSGANLVVGGAWNV
jgi:NAD(P)-dependent dehydrogenase (short-subunit alcohol dehydrogenase family)